VFLSAVSSEFETARNEIANDLDSRNIHVKVQRSFRQEAGADTVLRLLHDYIASCTAVVCVMGKRSGAFPTPAEALPFAHLLPAGLSEASYTQWEFIFARHHQRRMSVHLANEDYRPVRDAALDDRPDVQDAFLTYVRALGQTRWGFSSNEGLRIDVLKQEWPPKTGRKPKNLPFATLGPLFKGREKFLDDLHAALTAAGDGKAAAVTGKAVHGLGGVGKTRVAIEYAWRHAWEYSALLFVPAETPERLAAGLAALVATDILDLAEKDEREDSVKIAAALRWLEHHPTWLMILDNVDDRVAAEAVEQLPPKLSGGHVVITARNTNFAASIESLELDVLRVDDATEFLLERTRGKRRETPDDDALARELATELGGLALGLEQAGAYIATQRITFERYLKLWTESRAKVLGWFDRSLMAYDHDVGLAATWATSVEKLTPAGRCLLERLAFFAPEPIPESLLDVAVPAADGDFDAYEALADLDAYSLVSRSKAENGTTARSFAVHRLVQDFTRCELARRGRRTQWIFRLLGRKRARAPLAEAVTWLDTAFVGEPQDVRHWPKLDPLAPHALALSGYADKAGISQPTSQLLRALGGLFRAKSDFLEAERLTRRALALAEASLEPDHPDVAPYLNDLAGLLRATNRSAEAEPMYCRARAIREASYGPNHPNVAVALDNLAQLLLDTNRHAEAEPMFRRALEIFEASYGRDHPEVATCLNNLAQLLHQTHRHAEAEPLMRRVLAIDEASYGPDYPNVARDLDNLAMLLQDTNRAVEAEPLYRRALEIFEANYGPHHREVAICLSNLAQLLIATNRHAEAEPLYRRALEIFEARHVPHHPEVAACLNNLAGLLQDTNRRVEAEPLYRRALEIQVARYGPDHPRVATVLNNLGVLLGSMKRLGEAEPLMRRHVEILLSFTVRTGHPHPHLLDSLNSYANLLMVMGRSKVKARASIKALALKHGLGIDGKPLGKARVNHGRE